MHVFVNGEPRDVAPGATLADLLEAVSAPSAGIAVEVNLVVVRRADHATRVLTEGDRVEVVRAVGGG